jgi:hypothetical protein
MGKRLARQEIAFVSVLDLLSAYNTIEKYLPAKGNEIDKVEGNDNGSPAILNLRFPFN